MIDQKWIDNKIEEFKGKELSLPNAAASYIALEMTDNSQKLPEQHLQANCPQPFGITPVILANISSHRTLACGPDIKTVHEITLQLPQRYEYLPGNTIGILAENRLDEVEEVLNKFEYVNVFECPFNLSSNNPKKKLPTYLSSTITIRRALTECLDLHSIPKKLFLRALSECTTDVKEKRFLEILSSKEGSKSYSEFVESGSGSFFNLVRLLQTCHPHFNILLEHLPRLLPRPYSIRTSPMHADGKEIKVVFSVENGLVTKRLENMIIDDRSEPKDILIYFRQPTNFKYSNDILVKNVIMIGPGTGISPFIGFLDYKRDLMRQNKEKSLMGKAWLFTGCRYQHKNHLFKDEIDTFLQDGTLDIVSEAFSRDTNSDCRYVQDQIKKNSAKLVDMLLTQETKLFVCGEGKKMLPDIEKTIVNCLIDVCLISESEALDIVKNWKIAHKYIEDVWF